MDFLEREFDPENIPEVPESGPEGPRSARERLVAFAEMRHLIQLQTAEDLEEMKKEVRFLALSYKLAAQRLEEVDDPDAESVRDEARPLFSHAFPSAFSVSSTVIQLARGVVLCADV